MYYLSKFIHENSGNYSNFDFIREFYSLEQIYLINFSFSSAKKNFRTAYFFLCDSFYFTLVLQVLQYLDAENVCGEILHLPRLGLEYDLYTLSFC